MRDDRMAGAAVGLAPADFFWAIGSLCNLHRVPFEAGLLAQAFPPPYTAVTLIEALRAAGFEAQLLARPLALLAPSALPAIVVLRPDEHSADPRAGDGRPDATTVDRLGKNGAACAARQGTLALLVRMDDARVLFFAAGQNTPQTATRAEFAACHAGLVVDAVRAPSAARDADTSGPAARFGFRWFVPELWRHKRIWREVLAASLAIQLLALALPLCSQAIIDKVIVHRTTSTLAVIGAALALIVVFSAALGWIRQYLVIHTGNRVDAVLGAAVFRHLLEVPLRYFERRPTGVLAARLAGIETIREFLSGAAVTLALDLPFLFVFLVVMFLYSVPLSLVTLALVGALVALSLGVAPLFQRRLDAQFLAGARNQAFVTEHLAGIETVKSLQLEPQLAARYEELLARFLATGFATRQLGNSYQTLASGIEQLLSATILCLGAFLVMSSTEFTIGMLVAFQMFAGRVAQPLLRLAGLWQQFQQAAIAVRRLGDVMDVPCEPRTVAPAREPRAGTIELRNVGFRYTDNGSWLYRKLSIAIAPGELVVVTGPSGCGKSTLFKLLQGFAFPAEGEVLVAGADTRRLSANELRARFGVVPQETTLFSGTILDNLQLANPLATFEHVVQACRMAEIHSAIEALPEGYRTEVGERGVGLSGGQKQRLALARALLRRPQVLLLDEPVSQLDPESAARIAAAVSRLKGKLTIVLVSHQLPSSLRFDRIIELAPASA